MGAIDIQRVKCVLCLTRRVRYQQTGTGLVLVHTWLTILKSSLLVRITSQSIVI